MLALGEPACVAGSHPLCSALAPELQGSQSLLSSVGRGRGGGCFAESQQFPSSATHTSSRTESALQAKRRQIPFSHSPAHP